MNWNNFSVGTWGDRVTLHAHLQVAYAITEWQSQSKRWPRDLDIEVHVALDSRGHLQGLVSHNRLLHLDYLHEIVEAALGKLTLGERYHWGKPDVTPHVCVHAYVGRDRYYQGLAVAAQQAAEATRRWRRERVIEAAKDMTVAELREVLATVEAQRAAVSGEVPHVG